MPNKKALDLHKKLRGKIETKPRVPLTRDNLPLLYTPGVAEVSKIIAKKKELSFDYTSRWNNVAIVTDGSRVLGLGNMGPEAALPVMEGKALLFKVLGDVNALPVCLDTQKTDEIISIVKSIAPNFGGINIEDIEAPRCFEIEEKLTEELDIPVFHDDQHGTTIVAFAAVKNALSVLGKKMEDSKIVIAGAGAAGVGIAGLLSGFVKDIIVVDSRGAVYKGRKDGMNAYKKEIAKITNMENVQGDLRSALVNADVFIGVSGTGGLLKPKDVRLMNKKPVVLALSNPDPEITPAEAVRAGAAIAGTGRNDFPNQVNNMLAFPGVFRGVLDARAKKITAEMGLAAAHALASSVKPTARKILPDSLDTIYVKKVASAVERKAIETGLSRK